MKPYGLVLAGGGAKGAYQIGAWKAMREMGVTFNAVAGVSIGSINGALIVADEYEKALELWQTVTVDKGVNIEEELPDPENLFSKKNWVTLFRELIKKKGIDASPTRDFLSDYIDEEKIRKQKIPFAIVTVQMTQGVKPLELFLDDIPEGQLIDYLLASSNVPLVAGIGPEGERFLDGGVYNNVPVSVLRKSGYNRLIVVDISTIKGVSNDLDFTNSETIYIKPYNTDDIGAAFDFDSQTIEMRMEMGYLDTRKAFSKLSGKIYYFTPRDFKALVKKYGPDTVQQLEKFAYELNLERLKVYSKKDFLLDLKQLYEQKKEEQTEQEPEKESAYSAIIKSIFRRKNDDEFQDAVAVLDSIVI
ncbi:MAG: patatin-like phospholipase family protein [Oscillospiraceae bacterium]|nr:patatin-like phospholipase family protein [Oscillospiraceae bacterium]